MNKISMFFFSKTFIISTLVYLLFKRDEWRFLQYYWSDKGFLGIVVIQAYPSKNKSFLELCQEFQEVFFFTVKNVFS